MGLTCRRYVLAEDGSIFRIANAKLARMMRAPESEPVARFADQRVRSAEVLVEMENGKPLAVLRCTYSILQFDSQGCIDVQRYENQQMAMVDLLLSPMLLDTAPKGNVLQASSRFVAQGGAWTVSPAIQRQIENAALGRLRCPLL